MKEQYDLIVVGAGPAGLAAGIYALRAGLDTVILEKENAGGQVLSTYEVDNYPGLPESSGLELSKAFRAHFDKMGGNLETADVTEILKDEALFTVKTAEGSYRAKSVILSVGAHHAKLGVPGEEKLSGCGVSYCATCDGAFYKDAEVAVVGGGNVAVEDAIFLARFCKKVYVIHRRDRLRADVALQKELFALSNVEVLWDTTVTKMQGEDELEAMLLRNEKTKEETELSVEGVFVAVGILPDTGRFAGLAETDPQGYFIAGEDGKTSLPGLFVAGDARRKPLRQIVTAVADGANAVKSAAEYLSELT